MTATATLPIRKVYDFQRPIHQLNRAIDSVKTTNCIYEDLLCPQNPLLQKTTEAWHKTYSEFEQVFNGKTYTIYSNDFTPEELNQGFEEVQKMTLSEIKKHEKWIRKNDHDHVLYDYSDPSYMNMPYKLKYWICKTFLHNYYPEMNTIQTIKINRMGILHQSAIKEIMYSIC